MSHWRITLPGYGTWLAATVEEAVYAMECVDEGFIVELVDG